MSDMKQNKKHKQTLESAQYGLEISFNNNVKVPPYFDDFCIEKFKVHSYYTRGCKATSQDI